MLYLRRLLPSTKRLVTIAKKAVFLCGFFFTVFLSFFLLKNSFSVPDLTIVGYLSETDGLGRQSADLLDAMKDKFNINVVCTRRDKGLKRSRRFASYVCKKKRPAWGKVIIFEDMLWRPGKRYFRKILSSDRNKSIRIAYSVWESTELPQEWVEILNEHFDACVVPTPFLVDVYTKSGVTIPVFELPLALNLETFFQAPLKTKNHDPFVFGNLSACSDRKNQLLLVRAFAKAFGNDPGVMLRINSRYGEKEMKTAIEGEIAHQNLKNVIFTQQSLNAEEYIALFQTIDCYVSPSKGEGFSIQPREAMALGIPVIATKNTGQIDICDSGLILSLETPTLESAIFPWGACHGHYFNCEESALAEALIQGKKKSEKFLMHSEEMRSWAQKFQFKFLESSYQALVKPKKIELSEKNQIFPDRIVTNSEKLMQKYKRLDSN